MLFQIQKVPSKPQLVHLQVVRKLKNFHLSAKTAEIRWALKVVMCHYLLRSYLDTINLFKEMFPGSEVSSKFQMR